MKKSNQSGFAIIELLVVGLILAAMVGVGYYVWHEHNKTTPLTVSNSSSTYHSPPTITAVAPQITKASDLNSAMQTLDQTNITLSNTDSSQLATQTSGL